MPILSFPFYLCLGCSHLDFYVVQYAHRACVQRWCNEKGDTTCEICHEVSHGSNNNFSVFSSMYVLFMFLGIEEYTV